MLEQTDGNRTHQLTVVTHQDHHEDGEHRVVGFHEELRLGVNNCNTFIQRSSFWHKKILVPFLDGDLNFDILLDSEAHFVDFEERPVHTVNLM